MVAWFKLLAGVGFQFCSSEAPAATGADVVFDVTVPAAHEAVSYRSRWKAVVTYLAKKSHERFCSRAAQRMVATSNRTKKSTPSALTAKRYRPPIRALQSFLACGAIGAVQEAHADFFIGAHFGGFRDQMDFPLLMDMSIHTFDAARFLTGTDPVSVCCHYLVPLAPVQR